MSWISGDPIPKGEHLKRTRIFPTLVSGLIGIVVAIGIIVYGELQGDFTFSLDIRNSTVGPVAPQFFFKFHPSQMFTGELSSSVTPDNGSVRFTFSKKVTNLRIDPMVEIGAIELCDLMIRNAIGLKVLEWRESSMPPWVPLYDLEPPVWKSGCLNLKSTGLDPHLATFLPTDLQKESLSKTCTLALMIGLFCAIAMWPVFNLFFSSMTSPVAHEDKIPFGKLSALSGLAVLLIFGFWKLLQTLVLQEPLHQRPASLSKNEDFLMTLVDYQDHVLLSRGKYFIYLHPSEGYRSLPGVKAPSFNLDDRGFRKTLRTRNPKIRVAVSGGSTAFGMNVAGDENTIPSLLVKNNPEIQATNLGHIGYTLRQEVSLAFWETRPDDFDFFIALSGWNDFVVYQSMEALQVPHAYDVVSSPILESIALVREFTQGYRYAFGERRPSNHRPTDIAPLVRSVVDKISKFADLAHQRRAQFAFFFQPDLSARKNLSLEEREIQRSLQEQRIQTKDYLKYVQEVIQETKTRGIKVLDINSNTRIQNENESIFSDRIHLTALGNQIVVDEILRSMGWNK